MKLLRLLEIEEDAVYQIEQEIIKLESKLIHKRAELNTCAIKGRSLFLKELHRQMKFKDELEAVQWVQYTDYFNDGSPCEFDMGDMSIKEKGMEGFESVCYTEKEDCYQYLYNFLQNVPTRLMKAWFGDHSKITFTISGDINIELYTDHS